MSHACIVYESAVCKCTICKYAICKCPFINVLYIKLLFTNTNGINRLPINSFLNQMERTISVSRLTL